MPFDRLQSGLRPRARRVLAQCVGHYGYALTKADSPGRSADAGHAPELESIPRGRQEPFATAEYDVLPRGRFDIVRRDYYSPIPDLSLLSEEVWRRRSEMRGVRFDSDAGIGFIERELAPFIAELDIPLEDPGLPGVFFLHNTGFESVDAELLYAMIRHVRPRRVIELGSGYSTLLINLAAQRNAEDGVATDHVAYDPFPRERVLGESLSKPSRLVSISATDVPLGVFEELEAGDVLFVDTTHTVKLGSDVNFIVLDVLPCLRPGVIVHFHDVFLPWEYPRTWFEDLSYYWAEQYLLQAFLAFNDTFSVLVPAHAVAREYRERLGRVVSSFVDGVQPGSLWLSRDQDVAGEEHRSASAMIKENDGTRG